jgi:hypothetical protein
LEKGRRPPAVSRATYTSARHSVEHTDTPPALGSCVRGFESPRRLEQSPLSARFVRSPGTARARPSGPSKPGQRASDWHLMAGDDSVASDDGVELLPTEAGDGVDFFDRATKSAWDRTVGLLDPLQRLYKVDEDSLHIKYNNRPNMVNPYSRFIVVPPPRHMQHHRILGDHPGAALPAPRRLLHVLIVVASCSSRTSSSTRSSSGRCSICLSRSISLIPATAAASAQSSACVA